MNLVGLFVIVSLLTGCASASHRIVSFPLRGQSTETQTKDAAECEAFAEKNYDNEEVLKQVGIATVGGATVGVLEGAVLGALGTAGAGRGAGIGAAVGAVTGLAVGVWTGLQAEHARMFRIYSMCMNTRGYNTAG